MSFVERLTPKQKQMVQIASRHIAQVLTAGENPALVRFWNDFAERFGAAETGRFLKELLVQRRDDLQRIADANTAATTDLTALLGEVDAGSAGDEPI